MPLGKKTKKSYGAQMMGPAMSSMPMPMMKEKMEEKMEKHPMMKKAKMMQKKFNKSRY